VYGCPLHVIDVKYRHVEPAIQANSDGVQVGAHLSPGCLFLRRKIQDGSVSAVAYPPLFFSFIWFCVNGLFL
jgi:hypothetical protein